VSPGSGSRSSFVPRRRGTGQRRLQLERSDQSRKRRGDLLWSEASSEVNQAGRQEAAEGALRWGRDAAGGAKSVPAV